MKRQRIGIKYRAMTMLVLWAIACSVVTGGYVQRVQATEAGQNAQAEGVEIELSDGETLTELSGDGIYMLGGFDYEASLEDYESEYEEAVELNSYHAEQTGEEVSDEAYTSAEEAMMAALNRCETIVEFPTDASAAYTVTKAEVSSLVNGFLNSHPEYFYLDKVSYVGLSNGLVRRLLFTYKYDKDTITTMRAEYAKALQEAVDQVDPVLMDVSQMSVVIHDYLASICDYVYVASDADEDEMASMRYTAYGALVNGQAVCQGYALAYQDIMNALAPDGKVICITVGSKEIDHAWNMVEIDDSYYHVDVTWDDSHTEPGQVYHNNILLSKQDMASTGHRGYSLAASINESTVQTYKDAYWKNVYSQIYFVGGALYYIYPANVGNAPTSIANQSTYEQFRFIKKPVEAGSKNVELLTFTYAQIQVEGEPEEIPSTEEDTTEDNTEEDTTEDTSEESQTTEEGEEELPVATAQSQTAEEEIFTPNYEADTVTNRLTELFRQLKSYARLVHDADTWYINSAYGIYSVDMADAKEAVEKDGIVVKQDLVEKTEVFRIPDMDEADLVVYGIQENAKYAIINGLQVVDDTLYYQTEDGELAAVPDLVLTKTDDRKLYVYESKEPLVLSWKDTYQLHPFMIPSDSDVSYAYTSSAEQYVKVDPVTGLISADAYTPEDEPVTITIQVPGTSYKETVQVIVRHIKVFSENGLLLSNSAVSLEPGQTKQLSVCIRPGNATCQEVSYSIHSVSSVTPNQQVIDVDKNTGLVTAVNPGTAKVRATLLDYSQNKDGSISKYGKYKYTVDCTITVAVKPVAFALSPHSVSLQPGETQMLTYGFSPENTTDQKVVYQSSNTAVATVSETGEIQAVAAGMATITVAANAKTAAGKQLSDSCVVTVIAPEPTTEAPTTTEAEVPRNVQGISLNQTKLSMSLLDVETLTATITPDTATNKGIIWTSSDKTVVTVKEIAGTSKAELKAVAEGAAVIRATTLEGAFVAECTVTVGKRKLSKATFTKVTKQTYTGKQVKPAVTVKYKGKKLKKNKDYKITYKNNKKIGVATITIKGIGYYTGTKKITFTIAPKVPKAEVKAGSRSALVTYERVAEADGYQIVYAKNKTFTKSVHKVTVKDSRVTACHLTKLSKGSLYVKVRSYKVVAGKKIYSDYYTVGKISIK